MNPSALSEKKPPLKVRLCQNQFMKSSIFQISNSKIWRISVLKVLKLNITRYRTVLPDILHTQTSFAMCTQDY